MTAISMYICELSSGTGGIMYRYVDLSVSTLIAYSIYTEVHVGRQLQNQ